MNSAKRPPMRSKAASRPAVPTAIRSACSRLTLGQCIWGKRQSKRMEHLRVIHISHGWRKRPTAMRSMNRFIIFKGCRALDNGCPFHRWPLRDAVTGPRGKRRQCLTSSRLGAVRSFFASLRTLVPHTRAAMASRSRKGPGHMNGGLKCFFLNTPSLPGVRSIKCAGFRLISTSFSRRLGRRRASVRLRARYRKRGPIPR